MSDLEYRKSTRSNDGQGCVEVATPSAGPTYVRDTKDKGTGPVLVFSSADWQSFTDAAKTGQFDL